MALHLRPGNVCYRAPRAPSELKRPLINSACPWATTTEELRDLYNCEYTGAVTIRTSLLGGFPHDPSQHQYTFFSPTLGYSESHITLDGRPLREENNLVFSKETCSLNTLGYSPTSLDDYLDLLNSAAEGKVPGLVIRPAKPFIVSVAGSAQEIAQCYRNILDCKEETPNLTVWMEINLSCPNITGKPPPAYDFDMLFEYLEAIRDLRNNWMWPFTRADVPIGIKIPPYTHAGQFQGLADALKRPTNIENPTARLVPIDFITATNTLGSCLVFQGPECAPHSYPALSSGARTGIGGMAGDALHPLALGNVSTLRGLLAEDRDFQHIQIIGVGGVKDAEGWKRMMSAGADGVGLATALGREGVGIFKKIDNGLTKEDYDMNRDPRDDSE